MTTVALSFVVPSAVGQVVDDHIPEGVNRSQNIANNSRLVKLYMGFRVYKI